MNHHLLAVSLWLLAWLAVSVASALTYGGIRGHGTRLTAVAAAVALLTAAVLANAGADLW